VIRLEGSAIGHYRITHLIAQGKTALLYRGIDQFSNFEVVVKILRPDNLKSRAYRTEITHEYRIGRKLSHKNIIKMYSRGVHRKLPYIVMEYFPSTNLRQKIYTRDEVVAMIPKKIILLMAEALAYMHQVGYIHRDMKPENVLVDLSGNVKLIDIALASPLRGAFGFPRRMKKVQGTRSYMAPEQILGRKLDVTSDIYSLGITIYELLTKHLPFRADSPDELLKQHLHATPPSMQQYNREIHPDFSSFVMRMLAKNPHDRPRSMDDVLEHLANTPVFTRDAVRKHRHARPDDDTDGDSGSDDTRF